MPRGMRLRNSQNSRTAAGDARAQTVDVRAAFDRRNQVDVALGHERWRIRRPGERAIDRPRSSPSRLPVIGSRPEALVLAELLPQVFAEIAGEEPLVLLAGRLVRELDPQARCTAPPWP